MYLMYSFKIQSEGIGFKLYHCPGQINGKPELTIRHSKLNAKFDIYFVRSRLTSWQLEGVGHVFQW